MAASTHLFVARASWPIPQNETSTLTFIKMEKAEGRTPPKMAAIPHMMVNKPPQNTPEKMYRWGPHCPICTKSTPNPKTESSEDLNGDRQDQFERNYYPQACSILHQLTSQTDSLSIINQKRQEGEIGISQ